MRLRLCLLAPAALLALAACTPPPGPAGRVVDKATTYRPATKTRDWTLTVRTADGHTARFTVSPAVYDACRRGSSYPACTR
ncbi:hypothetical protein EST92_13025 [Streptomyces sp. TM32]|uniref:hypothetical protein n=1 Tax=Streptomyces sp. TM32 TaxID=1652669 RepID=UPI001012A3C5|nr:hypothetical protein [Streptomyces sp. TM32]RXS83783.1 hypothetical protein EST92_13025 [Streptomyces sp. TM32]